MDNYNDVIEGGAPGNEIVNPAIGKLNDLAGKTGVGFFQKLLPSAIGLLFVVGIVIFIFMILLGAIGWISSGGDKAALEGAKGKISNAIIGLVILLSTFALFKLIETFFGINILTIDIGPLIIQ